MPGLTRVRGESLHLQVEGIGDIHVVVISFRHHDPSLFDAPRL
jgi:hypothetical protein